MGVRASEDAQRPLGVVVLHRYLRHTVLSLVLVGAIPSAALARVHAQPAQSSRLGQSHTVSIHDTVLRGHAAVRAASVRLVGTGGSYGTADGSSVRVFLSPLYTPDPAVGQSWADFFD